MPLLHTALLATLQGLAEALPISRSGHEVVARLWLDEGSQAMALEGWLHLGTALALLAVARRRLSAAMAEGVRAVSRPTLFRASPAAHDAVVITLGTAVSLLVSTFVLPHVEMWSESPSATGVGLCVTGLSLASLAFVPRPAGPLRLRAAGTGAGALPPSLPGTLLIGLGHGLAIFPGASRVGAALTLLLWMGVKPGRALDLAFLITAPSLLVAFARGGDRAGLPTGTLVLGLLLAFVAAAAASELLRSLVERRRVSVLALWTIPLGLATLAYARALPLPS